MPLNNVLLLTIIVPVIGGLLGFGIYRFAYVSDDRSAEIVLLPSADTNDSLQASSETDATSDEETTPSQASPTNDNDVGSSAEPDVAPPGTVTDVFGGRMVRRAGSEPMNGKPARQYEFQVDSEFVDNYELKGNASGTVVISFQNEYDGELNTNLRQIWAYYNSETRWYEVVRSTVVFVDYEYAADFSDDRILVGAAHNVFVGRVVRQVMSISDNMSLETEFAVEIIENVKGDLTGEITVRQDGANKNGISYVPAGNERMDYILEPGSTYLFVTRYNESDNWHKLNPYPTASKLISKSQDTEQLKISALADGRVNQLKAAYPNEVLLDADIQTGKTYNDYQTRKPLPNQKVDETPVEEKASEPLE